LGKEQIKEVNDLNNIKGVMEENATTASTFLECLVCGKEYMNDEILIKHMIKCYKLVNPEGNNCNVHAHTCTEIVTTKINHIRNFPIN
jgi:hypothetical protein